MQVVERTSSILQNIFLSTFWIQYTLIRNRNNRNF